MRPSASAGLLGPQRTTIATALENMVAGVSARSHGLAPLSALHFVNDGLQASYLLALPLIASALGLTQVEVGTVASLHLLAGVLFSAPLIVVARRFEGHFLLVAVTAWGAGWFALTGLASGLGVLLAIGMAAGVGFGMFHPVALGLVARGSSPGSTSRSMGMFTAAGDLGRIAIASTILALLPRLGWRTVLPAAGLAVTLGSLPLLVLMARRRARSSPAHQRALQPISPRALRASKEFWLVCGFGFVDGLGNSALAIFLPFLLVARGVGVARLAALMSAFLVAGLCGRVVVGRLFERCGRRYRLPLCQAAIGLTVVGLCLSHSIAPITLWVVLLGVFNRGTLPILLSSTAEHLRAETVELGFAVNQAILGVAVALSPLLLGILSDRLGITSAFAAAAGLCGLNVMLLIATRKRFGSSTESLTHAAPSTLESRV